MDPANQPIEMPEINFEALQQPPCVDENLLRQIDAIIKSNNWTQSHQCITMIRQINKYYQQYIPNVINRYGKTINEIFENGKTQINKNILRLIKEIFDVGKQVNIEEPIMIFLPTLLRKSGTEIGHMKEMSQLVLASFAENCGYDISFMISAQFCNEKNVQIAEIALKLLSILVKNVGESITKLNESTLKCLMNELVKLIKGKRQNLKNSSLDICMAIYAQIGSENYLTLMNFALENEDIQAMGMGMESHRNQKAKHVPLADMLRQRKTEMIQNRELGSCNFYNTPYNQNGYF